MLYIFIKSKATHFPKRSIFPAFNLTIVATNIALLCVHLIELYTHLEFKEGYNNEINRSIVV